MKKLLLLFFICGCATHFEATYDPIMDAGLLQLENTGAPVFAAAQDVNHQYSALLWQPVLSQTEALITRAGQTALDTETYKSLVLLKSLTEKDKQLDSSIASPTARPYFFHYAGDTWLQAIHSIDSAELYKRNGRK